MNLKGVLILDTMSVNAELYDNIFEDIISSKYAEIKKNNEEKCCKNPYFMETEGFDVCTNCGTTANNRVFDDDIFSFDTGADNMYLHSKISSLYPESSNGTKIQGNSKMAQIQNWNSMPYHEHVVWEVSNNLKSMLFGYFSQKVISDSVYLYKDVYKKMDICRGANKKGIVAACVYFAAKKNNADKSPKQIAKIMDIDISLFNKSTKIYTEVVGNSKVEVRKSSNFTESYCTTLNLSFKIRKTVTKICDIIDDNGILNCFPHNACLSVIIFTCKEMGIDIDIKQTCKVFDVSYMTISKIYNNITLEKQNIFSKCT